tara:strand:- start:1927 stop:3225 length:1299 start_codon:yes stop_codon:yes gene_type:complete
MIASKLPYFNFRIIINLLLSLLPISFIAGNLVINLNMILIILASLLFWKKDFFKIKILLIDKLLIFLFLFSVLTSLINYNNFLSSDPILTKENLIKSIAYLRYLLFYFSIRLIIEKNYFNIKTFFISASICVIFVTFDLFLQFFSGKDIFGFPKSDLKVSGPFGDELIAGSYLQRFCLFLFFLVPFYKDYFTKINLNFLLLLVFVLLFFSIVISGNRMSVILFVLLFVFLFLLEKNLRKFLIILISFIFILFLTLYNFFPYIEFLTSNFLRQANQIIFSLDEIYKNNLNMNFSNTYLKEFYLGYMTWQENLILGGGINSFYLNCKINYGLCTSHPHNYYLEILSELGIVGMFITLAIFIKLFHLFFMIRNKLYLSNENNAIASFALLFFIEIFPFKTTGSFFTTGNSTYIFLLIAVIVGFSNKLIYYKKKQT